jgi:hypothetical protein
MTLRIGRDTKRDTLDWLQKKKKRRTKSQRLELDGLEALRLLRVLLGTIVWVLGVVPVLTVNGYGRAEIRTSPSMKTGKVLIFALAEIRTSPSVDDESVPNLLCEILKDTNINPLATSIKDRFIIVPPYADGFTIARFGRGRQNTP